MSNEEREREKPLKRSVGSGSNFYCTECKEEDSEFWSLAASKEHYLKTGHSILITTWFNSIFGDEEGYDNHQSGNESPY